MKARWDIFCSVVDNFGDIGVTWRLARQLVVEHKCEVRLWVDDLRAFERMCPEVDVRLDQQWQEGVDVRHWPAEWATTPAADVVIAAFACQLPPDYMEAMAQRERVPLWMNLDYLSAEDWVVGCHRLPSVKFKGVQKYFFFLASGPVPVGCCVRRGYWRSVRFFSRMRLHSDNSCKPWACFRQRVRGYSHCSPTKMPALPVGWTYCRRTGAPLIWWCRRDASWVTYNAGSVSRCWQRGMFISAAP